MKRNVIGIILIISMTAALAVGCSGKEESGNRTGDTTGEENTAGITFMAPDWAIPTDDQLKAFTDETGIEVVDEFGDGTCSIAYDGIGNAGDNFAVVFKDLNDSGNATWENPTPEWSSGLSSHHTRDVSDIVVVGSL